MLRILHLTSSATKTVCRRTLKTRMEATFDVMRKDISNNLPSKFVLAFDGWADDGKHYLGVFAVVPEVNNQNILLGFAPLKEKTSQSASAHIDHLTSLLKIYNKDIACSISYLIADNCNVNRKISNDLKIPLIGCKSHQLNLAIKRYLGLNHDDGDRADDLSEKQKSRRAIIDKVSKLMKKIKKKWTRKTR
jgi:hypothetical protein